MVYIIAGGRDEGKTRAMAALFRETGRGDGIISPKRFADGRFAGYDALRLSSGELVPLAVPLSSVGADWDEECRQGEYSFSGKGMAFVHAVLGEILERGIDPVFIDEVGPLELSGRGFAPLDALVSSGRDVYLSVRDRYLERVIEKYGLARGTVIPVVKDTHPLHSAGR